MWIGSIRLVVDTEDAPNAGTDSLVTATIVRDGLSVLNLNLNYANEDDLERDAHRAYDYLKLPRVNHLTPELPDGIGQIPMPYPSFGVEFSNGLSGHLKLRLKIHGGDMWIKDNVDVHIKEVKPVTTGFDSFVWQQEASWTHIGTWSEDVAMSTDFFEGVPTWKLALT